MKNHLQEIGESITAMAIIAMVIARNRRITLCFKIIGHLPGAH